MKKRGFALTEAIITLGIIGIVAAITFTLMNRFRADENKIMYLNAHDSLSRAVESLSNNSSYYPTNMEFVDESAKYVADVSEVPLYNIISIKDSKHQAVKGESKLCKLLAEAMNGQNENCSATISANDGTINWKTPSFTTRDGMTWIVGASTATTLPQQTTSGAWEGSFLDNVYVKLKPAGNECMYDTNCTKSNVFKFAITADGNIHVADDRGAQYLNTRSFLGKSDKQKGTHENVDTTFTLIVYPIDKN